MSRKFNDATVAFAILAYPYYSNNYLSEYIGCSKNWLEKISQKYKVKKAGLFNIGKLDGCQQENIIGVPFGDLIVIDKLSHKVKNNIVWKCICKCGGTRNVRSVLLRSGKINKCRKCYNEEKNRKVEHQKFSITNKQLSWFNKNLLGSAFDRGIEVNINFEYISELFQQQNRKCYFTGIDLEFPYMKNHKKFGTGSIDRIDCSKGYVEGNIRWVHKDINLMRNNHSDQYFIELCSKVYNLRGYNGT